MPIPRLRLNDVALLVIDVQDRLLPTIADGDRVAHNCATLLQLAGILGIPYLVTEQYPKGLGRTVPSIEKAMDDPSRRIEKTRFSAAVELVTDQLHRWRRGSLLLAGIEAHVCVLQTVLDFQASGRQCFVCNDAVSAGQRDQITPAFQRMTQAGAVQTGVMSALYELLGDSSHPAFRSCLPLIKDLAE